jgi:hypothetical protein
VTPHERREVARREHVRRYRLDAAASHAASHNAGCTTRNGTQRGLHHNVSEALFSRASSVEAYPLRAVHDR